MALGRIETEAEDSPAIPLNRYLLALPAPVSTSFGFGFTNRASPLVSIRSQESEQKILRRRFQLQAH